MATRILVTAIINPAVSDSGFVVEVQCIAVDPAAVPPSKLVFNVGDIALPEAAPGTWKSAIKAAVVTMAIALGFTDATAARTLAPDFS
jgi:shikimate kinase